MENANHRYSASISSVSIETGVASQEDADATSPTGTVAESNDQRFGDLVRAHRSRLYRFVLRNIGNPSDAEDIAQQAFVDAYRSMQTFRGESELSTWLYGIAMNLVRNYLNRAPHRVREYESDDVLENMPDSGDEPDQAVARSQVMRRLSEQIDHLPEELKQVFLLVAIDGLSYDEAAVLFQIPVGTVRSRLFRAREAIKNRVPDLEALLKST